MNTQRWMSIYYFIFYMTWGIFLPYWSGWMVFTKGLTVSEVSLIMSFGLIARGLSTLFAFPYLSGRFSNKALLSLAGIGTLVAILFYLPASSYISLLFVTIILHLFYPVLMPALDTAAGILLQSKQLKHYGRSRSWGSIGFVSVGMILTLFTGTLGENVIFWALLLGVLIFVSLGFMRAPSILSKKPQIDLEHKTGMLHLFRSKYFSTVLIIVILLQAAHATYYTYGYIFLQDIQAPLLLIGVIINIAVIAEIIFFTIADKIFHKFSVGSLLTLAAAGSSLRWFLVFAFPNVIVFSLAQILHAFSFAMAHYAFMKYLNKNIPQLQIPKAQGLYSAFALSWSTAFFTIFGGFLYEIEPRYAFLGMLVCTLPAMLLALVYRKVEIKKEGTLLFNS
ncbi:MFS transporter [Sutcliffiella rhizosphaerae]|uniref:3-phenylpropionic acid transporter n=1 Tax=Sutcliffiella rhizosphaerae TaxID=2880967 RepID=A0ABM8YRX1_9BACI|nr:MFS transporter [Sutcliffiella rhizosphaerae]CAG9622743.1 putative 3-phenylpropionic acid transporter [Sutcliffiella rhizosphaerae]